MRFDARSLAHTAMFAEAFAQTLKAGTTRVKLWVALNGPLGSGKTTFVKKFLRALGSKTAATSPSFVLRKTYQLPKLTVEHVDCYRLRKQQEFGALGLLEEIAPGTVVLVEWAEKIGKTLPSDRIRIDFAYGRSEQGRVITVRATGLMSKKLLAQWQQKVIRKSMAL